MAAPETHDALDNLVNQFADPMSFFRELVQNALDAGTPEIEVDFEYEPGKLGQQGVMIVHVDDFGEGMDREIIDTRLTRLFSSSKDGDLTKIGRFGIGFVSVFAIEPDAVCVDTSRGGENWRVLFKRDRTFVRIARDEPVDGTKIRILKTASEEEYDAFVQRAYEVVSYWCKHASSDILFQGEPVNQPFDLSLPCKVTLEEPGTRVIAAYHPDEAGWFGFYNKGLTLHEGAGEFWPHIAFKVDSRYLEHTLTRDNVLRDDNFAKAREIVADLVERQLPGQLLEELERRRDRPEDPHRLFLYETLARVAAEHQDLAKKHPERRLFTGLDHEPVTLETIRQARRKDRLWVDTERSPLITGLQEEEGVVIETGRRSAVYEALSALVGELPPRANDHLCRPTPATSSEEAERWASLCRSLRRLLDDWGARLTDVVLAHLRYPGSSISSLPAITQREFGEITRIEDVQRLGTWIFQRKRVLVVNADHPLVRRLLLAARQEPEFAAYEVAKLFFLRRELTTEIDGELMAVSLQHRQLRRAGEGA